MPEVRFEAVSHVYSAGTPFEHRALQSIDLTIPQGQFVGLLGHTGSGKSTLIQHFNALLQPTSGTVFLDGKDINGSKQARKEARFQVGLVFQYPEYQLFEETVLQDVMFGPLNQGKTRGEAERMAIDALRLVNFPEASYQKSPFEISGGQKRRAAIAGVLSMEPEILILDEPAAGLDPKGRENILNTVAELRNRKHITIILVSHSMDDVAVHADRIMAMDHGKLAFFDTPGRVFSHIDELERMGLSAPQMTYLARDLNRAGFHMDPTVLNLEDAKKEILRNFGR